MRVRVYMRVYVRVFVSAYAYMHTVLLMVLWLEHPPVDREDGGLIAWAISFSCFFGTDCKSCWCLRHLVSLPGGGGIQHRSICVTRREVGVMVSVSTDFNSRGRSYFPVERVRGAEISAFGNEAVTDSLRDSTSLYRWMDLTYIA